MCCTVRVYYLRDNKILNNNRNITATKEMLVTEDSEFDIFVSSKIGSFKHIKYHTDQTKNNKKCIENLVEIKTLQKDDSVTCMEWGNAEQTEILLGRKNQKIQLYDTLQGFTKSYTADFGSGDVVGLGRCKRKLLAAVSSGVVRVWSKKEEQIVDTGGKLDRMVVCQDDPTLFATGGEENDLKVWRIGEKEPTFAAKNLPNDWLQLRRPVWVSGVAFLPGEAGNITAVCSRHGYVRLYDSRAQRRPVCSVEFPNMAATCLATSLHERQVLVGFGRGQLTQVDLRKGKPDKGYKGATGAITSVATVTKGGPFVVSTSLDRSVRVHHYESKELVYKQYLTSKLSSLLVQSAGSTPLRRPGAAGDVKEEVAKEEEVEEDMDLLFDSMDTVGEKPKRKVPKNTEITAKKSKPSVEGSTTDLTQDDQDGTQDDAQEDTEDAIKKLLKSTEKQKKKIEKRKKEKKAKSLFHNA